MWKDIEEINWTERSKERRGYESGKRYILENFTQTRCKKIHDFVDARFKELYKRIEQFEQENRTHCGNYGGDDSFGDMIYHAIGLGEEYFNSVMENPKLLDELDYQESFSYCLPYDDDFEAIVNGYYENKARDCLYELARILKENDPSEEDVKVILGLVKRFCAMAAGDFKKACGDVTEKNYSKFYQFESNDCSALFANILSDCKKFKL